MKVNIPKLFIESELKKFCKKKGYEFMKEHRFDTVRKFRFDYAITHHRPVLASTSTIWVPDVLLAIEYNGGIFMNKSGHSNVSGLKRDYEKLNLAQLQGWKVLQYSAANYKDITNDLKQL